MSLVRNLAARIAGGFRSSGRIQPPMRRKALFEALEQRFMLSAETPPVFAPALPGEAWLDLESVRLVRLP